MAPRPDVGLRDLSAEELAALRLAAQVMAHRAQAAGRGAVALYFDSLEATVLAEQAGRAQAADSPRGEPPSVPQLVLGAGTEDRRLIAQYLKLLVNNELLPPGVRRVCDMLQRTPPR